jgi:signal transduction histidine kinase
LNSAPAAGGAWGLAVTAHVLAVVLPVGFGLFRLARRSDDRFARLLVATGVLWSLTILALSSDSTLYSLGRIAVWLAELALVYLLLAFPYGRLTTTVERVLASAAALVAALLYLPTAFFAQFPEPTPWTACGAHCPRNAFAPGHSSPAFAHDFMRPLRETLTVLLFAGVAALLARRARRGPRVMRRAVAPVAALALVRVAALAAYDVMRGAGVSSGAADVFGWIYAFSLPALALSFAAGLLGQRLFVANALQRLTLGLRSNARAAQLRTALAEALDDPTLRIVYWLQGDPGRWVDETGWPVKPPDPDEERQHRRAVTEVAADGRRLAAIVHDITLSRDPALVRAATSYALGALENERLVGQLNASLRELSDSRARIVAVADQERRNIERDLHDGAQQRLVVLRIKLGLVADRLEAESPESANVVRALEEDVEGTIDEVRSFARGVYPSLLAERGLSEALGAAGRTAPLPTSVDADGIGRHPPELEATVYFACMEALQNAAKHASGARGAAIAVSQDGRLRFEVRDDGAGFSPRETAYGTGLTNLRDRLAAVGGELGVESAPGEGTTITGVIPLG